MDVGRDFNPGGQLFDAAQSVGLSGNEAAEGDGTCWIPDRLRLTNALVTLTQGRCFDQIVLDNYTLTRAAAGVHRHEECSRDLPEQWFVLGVCAEVPAADVQRSLDSGFVRLPFRPQNLPHWVNVDRAIPDQRNAVALPMRLRQLW